MEVYRLAREKYAKKLSGVGAAKYGNRWNSKGVEIIYTASSRAFFGNGRGFGAFEFGHAARRLSNDSNLHTKTN